MNIKQANLVSNIMEITSGLNFIPLVDGMIEEGSIGMIVGGAKSKKSMLAMNLAFSLITGKNFLGHTVSTKTTKDVKSKQIVNGEEIQIPKKIKIAHKILYVNLELTTRSLGVRLNTMNIFYKAGQGYDNVAIINTDTFMPEGTLVNSHTHEINKRPFKDLADAAIEWGATVIIIDPLYYIIGEENDNMLVTLVLREIQKLRTKTDSTVIVIHHTRKERTDWKEPFMAGRGASSIGGFFEWVIGIDPNEDNDFATIHHGSRNYKALKPWQIKFHDDCFVWQTVDELKTKTDALDLVMGEQVEMPTKDFIDKARKIGLGGIKKITNMIDHSLNFKRIKGRKGIKAMVVRIT